MKALRILIFVVVMGSISGVLLVGVDAFTSPMIAKNEELKIKSAVLDALELPYEKETVFSAFDTQVKAETKGGKVFYKASDGSTAFEFRGPGLWGAIYGIASVNADLSTIKTIKILHQEETPGLGARIAENSYLSQFKGKEFSPRLLFVPQGKARARHEVDAITGATLSSRALEKLLNEALGETLVLLKEKIG